MVGASHAGARLREARRLRAGDRAGCDHRRDPDGRLHEPRGVAANPRHGKGHLLEHVAERPLGEGRNLGPRPARPRGPRRLRRGRRAAEDRAGRRRRLSPRLPELLLPPRRRSGLAHRRRPPRSAARLMDVLRLGVPKGSLEAATIELFRRSGWKINADARSYFPTVDDPSLRCLLVRAQEMARYVESGTLDAGITGRDWVLEHDADVVVAQELVYSKTSLRPTRWVLVVGPDSAVQRPEDLRGGRIATELVGYTRRWFAERGIDVHIEFSWGATEAKVAEGLVDAIVEVTETGSTIRAHGLRIVCELFESVPQLIANRAAWDVPWKREKVEQIGLLLGGALRAEAQVCLKMNVPAARLQEVIALLPAITAPTVSNLNATDWFAVESVIAEATVRDLIPRLLRAGAVGIIEYPLNKLVG